MEANTLMSIRKIKAQKGQKNKSYRDLKSDQKNKRIILENQNIKTCAHDRTREWSAEKISALVTSEQKPPASGTNTPGQDPRLCASGNSLSFKVWALYHLKANADKDYSLLWH